MRQASWFAGAALMAAAMIVAATAAELTTEQQQAVAKIDAAFEKAAAVYRAKNLPEFEKVVGQIKQSIDELAAGGGADETLVTLRLRLEAAERLLTTARTVETKPAAPTPGTPTRPTPTPTRPAPVGDQVSFVNHVAPILVAKCSGCHIRQARGNFSLATYPDLMRGSTDGGPVFRPGTGKGSRLVDLLETQAMPPNGNPCSPDEVALITKWIDQGAKFDGPDPRANLAALVPAGSLPGQPSLVRAGGNEQVQLMRDLSEVIARNCVECHSGDNPSENLDLANFTGMLRGGRSGQIFTPGNPAGSLLIQKLKGTARLGDRMPQDRPPLPDDVIAKFEQWIADGAKFDGNDPNLTFDMFVRIRIAQNSTHDELAKMRADLADRHWKMSSPEITPDRLETEQFLLLGNVGPVRLEEVAKQAEDIRQKVAGMFKLPGDKPSFKGRLTIFVFDRRFDYTEFGQMVEKRELPREMSGHWRYTIVDGYVAVQSSKDDPKGVGPLLAEGIVGSYLDTLGELPRWWAIGVARNHAARLEPANPSIKVWEDAVPVAIAAGGTLDAFLTTQTLDGRDLVLSYGFTKALMRDGGRHSALMNALQKKAPFDLAFRQAYGADPKTVAAGWIARGGR